MTSKATQATEEQVLYADILEKGMFIGLGLMIVAFAVYVFGILPPMIPLNEISAYWNTPVHDYLVAINQNFIHGDSLVTGWAWMKYLGYGDFLNFLPIAILSGVTILCYIVIAPGLFARGDKAMAIMAVAEVVILALAASGLLTTGGH